MTFLVPKHTQVLSSWKERIQLALTSSQPLSPPRTIPDLEHRPVLERITETLRYSIFSLEYALSPQGGLRQWLKINLSFFLLFGIPILVFAPLLTFFLVNFTSITAYLLHSLWNIFLSIVLLIAMVTLIWGAYKGFIFLRYSEWQMRNRYDREFEHLQQEIQHKREQEFQRLTREMQARRKEEYQRISREIRQERVFAQQQIKQEVQQHREEQQKLEQRVQQRIKEEQQQREKDELKRIQAWKNQLSEYDQRSESPIEKQFWDVAKHRLPGLIPQYKIDCYRVDFALPDKHLVLELDGHDYHKSKQQRTADAKRERDLQEMGWYVIRFTGTEIYRDVKRCVAQVERLCHNIN